MNFASMSQAELIAALTTATEALAARDELPPARAYVAFWPNRKMRSGKKDAPFTGPLDLNVEELLPLLAAASKAKQETVSIWTSLWDNGVQKDVLDEAGELLPQKPRFSGNARNLKR